MPDPAVPGDDPGQHDLAAVARDCLAHGDSLDQAAQAVLGRTRSPIAAIKAMRQALPGLSLAEAKPLVHRNLPPGMSRAAGKLWDDLESAAAELAGGSPPELTGE